MKGFKAFAYLRYLSLVWFFFLQFIYKSLLSQLKSFSYEFLPIISLNNEFVGKAID